MTEGASSPRRSAYRAAAESAALAWKGATPTLPAEARGPGRYIRDGEPSGRPLDLCLPVEFARLNLLPDVRDAALAFFAEEQVAWHGGGGPSNHLLSSQIQCLNALTPGLSDPDFVRDAFGGVLSIAEVLPVEPGRYLTFEFIGSQDYLGEGRGLPRTRGTMTTSSDAAIKYRTVNGAVEMALVEWKFAEDYRAHELKPPRGRSRASRYLDLWNSAAGSFRSDLVPYDDLFVEPMYQLLRQQLLAWAMESDGSLCLDAVRVVHICPTDNDGVHSAARLPSHVAAGGDPIAIWSELVGGSRFASIDSSAFLREGLRTDEYRDRYGIECRDTSQLTHEPRP